MPTTLYTYAFVAKNCQLLVRKLQRWSYREPRHNHIFASRIGTNPCDLPLNQKQGRLTLGSQHTFNQNKFKRQYFNTLILTTHFHILRPKGDLQENEGNSSFHSHDRHAWELPREQSPPKSPGTRYQPGCKAVHAHLTISLRLVPYSQQLHRKTWRLKTLTAGYLHKDEYLSCWHEWAYKRTTSLAYLYKIANLSYF